MYSRENACSDLFDKSRSGLDSVLHFLTIISQWGNSNKLLHPKKKQYASKMFHWQASFLEKGIAPSFPAGTSTFWILLFKHASEANFYFLYKENSRVTTESCWEKKAISQLETSRAVHTPRCSVFFKLFVVNTYPIDAMCCKGNCEENLHIDLWVPLSEWWKFRGVFECFITL